MASPAHGLLARGREHLRGTFFPGLLLLFAFLLALLSAYARQIRHPHAAAFLAVAALIFVAIVSVTLIPRLGQQILREMGSRLKFFRVTRRGAFFLLLFLLVGFSTLNTGNNLLVLVLSFSLSAVLVSGMASNIVLHGLEFKMKTPRSLHAGQRAVFLLTCRNAKRWLPSFALQVKVEEPPQAKKVLPTLYQREIRIPYLSPGSLQTQKLEAHFHRRGVYSIQAFEVTTRFPFGFFTRGRRISANGSVVVYPKLMDLQPFFSMFPYLEGPQADERKGQGAGLYNIRDYQQGDEFRHVHWKSTGKLGRVMVKEFIQEEDNPLQVLWSTYLPERTGETLARFERAVSLIATLMARYQADGIRVEFQSGEHQALLDGSTESYENLMTYLAWVEPADQRRLELSQVKDNSILFVAGQPPWTVPSQVVDYLSL